MALRSGHIYNFSGGFKITARTFNNLDIKMHYEIRIDNFFNQACTRALVKGSNPP